VKLKSKHFTTAEAAAKIGVSRQTLYSWIAARTIAAPTPIALGKGSIRLWTKTDIEEARKFKGKLKPGPQKRKK
jgi:excisionase family DNA binding protein